MDGGSGVRKIRTTNRPDDLIEVDEAEFLDLTRMGLVRKDETPKKDLPKEEAK